MKLNTDIIDVEIYPESDEAGIGSVGRIMPNWIAMRY